MFGKLGDLAGMLKQAQQMQGKVAEIQEELKKQRVTGQAGAGMVEVVADGTGEVLEVKISDDCFAEGDKSFIETLIPQAINEASAKAKQAHQEMLQELTGGMSLPGMDKMMGNLFGGGN